MGNVTLIKLDLLNENLRAHYSCLLQAMETVFEYPLGEAKFLIRHGFGHGQYDYFSYFEQLGEPFFYVLMSDHQVVGSICCVLRIIDGQQVWYICDLKIIPTAQFKNLPRLIYELINDELAKITQAFYFVNMSPMKNNGLYTIAHRLMRKFPLEVTPYYIYEFSKNQLRNDAVLAHNQGKKDIVIEGNILNLYHVMNGVGDRCKDVMYATKEALSDDAVIMLGSTKRIKDHEPSSEGIFVTSSLIMRSDLSTFEV